MVSGDSSLSAGGGVAFSQLLANGKNSRGRCRNQSMSPGAASVEQARTEQMVREDKTERVPQSRAAERGRQTAGVRAAAGRADVHRR